MRKGFHAGKGLARGRNARVLRTSLEGNDSCSWCPTHTKNQTTCSTIEHSVAVLVQETALRSGGEEVLVGAQSLSAAESTGLG